MSTPFQDLCAAHIVARERWAKYRTGIEESARHLINALVDYLQLESQALRVLPLDYTPGATDRSVPLPMAMKSNDDGWFTFVVAFNVWEKPTMYPQDTFVVKFSLKKQKTSDSKVQVKVGDSPDNYLIPEGKPDPDEMTKIFQNIVSTIISKYGADLDLFLTQDTEKRLGF